MHVSSAQGLPAHPQQTSAGCSLPDSIGGVYAQFDQLNKKRTYEWEFSPKAGSSLFPLLPNEFDGA